MTPATGQISAIAQRCSADDATALVGRMSPGTRTGAPRKVLYPYELLRWRISTRSIFSSKRSFEAFCLVDRLTGRAATADVLETEPVMAEPGELLLDDADADELLRASRDYVRHSFIHSTRIFAAPELELRSRETVYRPFWIVPCSEGGADLEVLVDGATGKMHVLPSIATPARELREGTRRGA